MWSILPCATYFSWCTVSYWFKKEEYKPVINHSTVHILKRQGFWSWKGRGWRKHRNQVLDKYSDHWETVLKPCTCYTQVYRESTAKTLQKSSWLPKRLSLPDVECWCNEKEEREPSPKTWKGKSTSEKLWKGKKRPPFTWYDTCLRSVRPEIHNLLGSIKFNVINCLKTQLVVAATFYFFYWRWNDMD